MGHGEPEGRDRPGLHLMRLAGAAVERRCDLPASPDWTHGRAVSGPARHPLPPSLRDAARADKKALASVGDDR